MAQLAKALPVETLVVPGSNPGLANFYLLLYFFVKKYTVHVVARLPQRLKSTLFEIFSNGGCPKGTRSVEKISNNVDFSL